MSGGEMFGLAAAATRLIGLGSQVALKIRTLSSDSQRLPDCIQSALSVLTTLVNACQNLKTSLESQQDLLVSAETSYFIQTTFDSCFKDTNELEVVLAETSTTEPESAGTIWEDFAGSKKGQELSERCKRLKYYQIVLILICQERRLQMIQQQSLTCVNIIQDLDVNMNAMLDPRTAIEASMNLMIKDMEGSHRNENVPNSPADQLVHLTETASIEAQRLLTKSHQSWMQADETLSNVSSNVARLCEIKHSAEHFGLSSWQNAITQVRQTRDDIENLIIYFQTLSKDQQEDQPSDQAENSQEEDIVDSPKPIYSSPNVPPESGSDVAMEASPPIGTRTYEHTSRHTRRRRQRDQSTASHRRKPLRMPRFLRLPDEDEDEDGNIVASTDEHEVQTAASGASESESPSQNRRAPTNPSSPSTIRRIADIILIAPRDLMERTRPNDQGLGPPWLNLERFW